MSFHLISPELLGDRLRGARSEKQLTQEAAASALGMSRTTLVAIERGQRRVKPSELVALAELYKTPVGHLTALDAVHVDLAAKFRRVESKDEQGPVGDAISLLNRLATGAVELERALGSELQADYPPPSKILANAYLRQAEDAAVALRQRLGIGFGRIGDLFSAFELDLGIRVFCRPLAGTISGLYAYDPAIGACILVNSNHPRRRRAQTLAHEAGHFVTDRSFADVLDEEPVPLSLEERFARRFGPAFLMPAPAVRTRFEQAQAEASGFDVRSLVLLAHQFDVSPEAMCRRLEELELLADGTWSSIKERGFNSDLEREVLGDPEPTSRPPLVAPRLAYLAASALERELLSEGQLCDLLVVDRVQLRNTIAPFDAGGSRHAA